jgi:hypothetical protein
MRSRRKLPEMVFQVEQIDTGEYVARALDGSIIAQAERFEFLKRAVVQAVSAHLKNYPGRIMIRFHLSRVSTSLLVSYSAAVDAWLVEISMILLFCFSKQKPDVLIHVVLLGITILLTAIAWRRRDEFRAMRGSIGRTPLSGGQMLVVTLFVLALSAPFTWTLIRLTE